MNLPLTVIEICYTAACMLTKVIYKMLTHKTLLAPPPQFKILENTLLIDSRNELSVAVAVPKSRACCMERFELHIAQPISLRFRPNAWSCIYSVENCASGKC